MRASAVRIWACAVAVMSCEMSVAQDKPNERIVAFVAKDYENPGAALSLLQHAHGRDESTFVAQDDLDRLRTDRSS